MQVGSGSEADVLFLGRIKNAVGLPVHGFFQTPVDFNLFPVQSGTILQPFKITDCDAAGVDQHIGQYRDAAFEQYFVTL